MDFGTASTATRLRIDSNGALQLGGTSNAGFIDFDSSSIQLNTQRNPNTGAFVNTGRAHTSIQLFDGAGTASNSYIRFFTSSSNNTTATERMRIDSSGDVGIGTTNPVAKLHIIGSHLQVNTETDSGSTVHHYSNTLSNGAYRVRFDSNSTVVGSIAVGTSSTAYNTTSDYRLKENIVTDWDATDRLKQLKPSRFNFKVDKDKTVDGFIAHEVSGIVPEATTGEKDAVDKYGNIEPQCIDQSKLVPLLTKSLQEAIARIDALEAEVKTLKGE